MIPSDVIESIRDRLDIVELVREYVPGLKRAGRTFKACCPFHQEKTPSFTVSSEKQAWYCFGCQSGGDVFGFVMRIENLAFPEVAQRLAERAGVNWKPAEEAVGPQERERRAVKAALEFAKDFYRRILKTAPEAEPARAYLRRRKVSPDIEERFELGFALSGGGTFLEAALRKGFQPDVLVKAGLAALREGGGRYRDYFWSRLLFPIRSARGEVSGFGGRVLGDQEPKYLNSPDGPLFSKGKLLYGLYQGGPSLRKEKKALLLEGYVDVLAAHQFGFDTAVAPLGTALTPDHVAALKRYVEDVVIVFDPDNAGANASLRSAELLLDQGLFVSIATVPEGLDPDELLHGKGKGAFEEVLGRATDLAEFQTELALRRRPPKSLEDKAKLAGEVLKTVSRQTNPILRQEWVKRLAQRLGLDEAALHAELERVAKGETKTPQRASNMQGKGSRPTAPPPPPRPGVEVEIVHLLLRHPFLMAKPLPFEAGDLQDERCRRVVLALKSLVGEVSWESPAWTKKLWEKLPAEDAPWVSRLLVEAADLAAPAGPSAGAPAQHGAENGLARLVQDWEKRRVEARMEDLRRRIRAGEAAGRTMDEELRELQKLSAKARGSKKI